MRQALLVSAAIAQIVIVVALAIVATWCLFTPTGVLQ